MKRYNQEALEKGTSMWCSQSVFLRHRIRLNCYVRGENMMSKTQQRTRHVEGTSFELRESLEEQSDECVDVASCILGRADRLAKVGVAEADTDSAGKRNVSTL